MKLLWLVNITLPHVAAALHITPPATGGWLSGQLAQLDKNKLDITVLSFSYELTQTAEITLDGVHYIVEPSCDAAAEQARCAHILAQHTPDLIHIHGTELSHSLSMLSVVGDCPTVISMQGLVYVCAQHYFANLPPRYHKASLAKRILRLVTKQPAELIAEGQQWFATLGEREKQVLRQGTHFIGRTGWDEHHLKAINPTANYYKCNEILRNEFYHASMWDYANCNPHSIFISQGNYPLKGLHILLDAIPLLQRKYPDVQIYLTGTSPLNKQKSGLRGVCAQSLQEYPAYLARQIKKLNLQDRVHYLGMLDGVQMRAQYLAANVYVLASSMENSPNSLAEAMMLGTPCVASDVGGVADLLQDKTEGLLYPFGAVQALAQCIDTIFSAKESAAQYGQCASAHAHKTHDPHAATIDLMEIYNNVIQAHQS